MTALRFLLAGGGTSGHITPALAIAQQILRDHPDAQIRFCGTARGLESEIVPKAGFDFTPIRASGLPGKPSVAMIRALLDFAAGRRQCLRLLKAFQPNAVIGTGGYVCSPVVSAAVKLKIPVLLHEQNAYPGRSNRLMARKSQVVCISFADSRQYFPDQTRTVLTGNPVRPSFFSLSRESARAALGISPGATLVLVTGGSLGAKTLNQAVQGLDLQNMPSLNSRQIELKVVLAAGRRHYEMVKAETAGKAWLSVHEYLHNMDQVMAGADLIICRAGAMTCAELAALGRPSVLVPYPYAAGDHQTKNAMAMVDEGAAIHIKDSDLDPDRLAQILDRLLPDHKRLEAMGKSASRLARPDAAKDICQALYEVML